LGIVKKIAPISGIASVVVAWQIAVWGAQLIVGMRITLGISWLSVVARDDRAELPGLKFQSRASRVSS
jgi:hypothetical protein